MKKKQIQSYLLDKDYKQLKKLADADGDLFASFVRKILLNYLKQNANGK